MSSGASPPAFLAPAPTDRRAPSAVGRRVGATRTDIHGTHVPVEEPSTASIAEVGNADDLMQPDRVIEARKKIAHSPRKWPGDRVQARPALP